MSGDDVICAYADERIYELSNGFLSLKKKNGKLIAKDRIENVKVLHFTEKNMFGRGQIVMILECMGESIIGSFKKEEQRESFRRLFEKLTENQSFSNMNYTSAVLHKNKDLQNLKDIGQDLGRLFQKKIEEYKCVCSECSHVWYFNEQDKKKEEAHQMGALGSMLAGSFGAGLISDQLVKENERCPKCGTRAVKIEKVKHIK